MRVPYVFRALGRSPGFVAIAVIALGVGLGLSTTMFAVMDAVLHPYVAYTDAETLYSITMWFGRKQPPMTQPELYRFIRDHTRSFVAVVPEERWGTLTLHLSSGEREVQVYRESPRYFPLTGMRVDRGRPFRAGDGDDAAIVGPDLWRTMYGRRRDLAGATAAIGDRVYRVVGVMPEGACGTCVWMPSSPGVESNGTANFGFLSPIVRLKPGVAREAAQAELKSLADGLTARFNAGGTPYAFDLVSMVERPESVRDIQKAMIGAALLVLIIACVNLSHLMLARGLAKRRELALRMALGASRAAVVRQMFAECAVITLAGASLGVAITLWGAGILRHMPEYSYYMAGLVRPQLSWRVFATSLGAAAASVVLFGLLPALRIALMLDVNDPLKDDAGTTTGKVRQRYSPLVVSEVALALVLLMGGGLLIRTLVKLENQRPQMNTETLYQGWNYWRRNRDDTLPHPSRRLDLLTAARGVPGIAAVAFVTGREVKGGGISAELTDSTRIISTRFYRIVTPNMTRVLGLPILKGRDFEEGDDAGTGVAIIDPVAAQILYRNQDPVGHMLKLGGPASPGKWVPIIGVVRSPSALEVREPGAPIQPTVWICERDSSDHGSFLVRLTRDDPELPARFQGRLKAAVDVSAYLYPFDWNFRTEVAARAFLTKAFVGMGMVALGLAALGLYGVLAYAVSRRKREFAVRMALGAEPKQLLRMVLHDGAVMLLAGTGMGAFAALAASRYLDSVLVAVLPSDVLALVLSEVVLLSVGFAAATAPARRAAKADPLDILRAV